MPSIISICGLRIRIFTSQEPFNYKTSFLTRDQTVLEAWLSNPELDRSGVAQHITNVAELPYEARRAVEDLLDDRKNSTCKPYGWRVEFISSYMSPEETASYFWQRKWSRKVTEKETKWMVLLRGGILPSEDATGRDSIERYRDPWSDEVKLGAEELKSSDFILGETRKMKKSQYRRMMEPEQVSSRSQSMAVPVDAFDDIKRPQEDYWSGWAGTKKSKKKKKTRVSVGATTTGEHSKSSMPSGIDDDLDFAATVSAGLQDTGFDPNIVIDDPSYRRRDSPPGDSEPKEVKFPHDLNYSPKSEGSGNEHYFELKLSKKEQKKRDKAARRSNLEFEDTRSVVKKRADEVLDPELTQPQFRPSIDPQYGDLLPLPPSDPTSLNVEPLDDLPRLPDNRPETPESGRLAKEGIKTAIRKSAQDSPIKSPSQSQVPLKFPRHRPRPASWDTTKEIKPLYLVESQTLGPSVQQLADDKPLPELGTNGWGPVAAGVAGAAAVLAEERRKEEERHSARSRRKSRARNDSISSLGGSDFGEGSRWRRGSSEHEEGSEEMLSEEQAERLMSAYLDTFTADGGDE
ncbi:hypothetical protein B0O99DRAFT_20642 [Bisporella sp. PMI_857]|nr:hypothetical protein B0O99DRAFT_20642 [Bisporella sp. PMI_857]